MVLVDSLVYADKEGTKITGICWAVLPPRQQKQWSIMSLTMIDYVIDNDPIVGYTHTEYMYLLCATVSSFPHSIYVCA